VGALIFPLTATFFAFLGPAVALGWAVAGYGGSFLMGLKLHAVTRAWRAHADRDSHSGQH
jgi:hypothetical protein